MIQIVGTKVDKGRKKSYLSMQRVKKSIIEIRLEDRFQDSWPASFEGL